MKHILIPTRGPADWQRLLASPTRHWRTGYSAKALAYCWEAASGFPPEVTRALDAAESPSLHGLELLLAIPEFEVSLPGGRAPSCTDLFVLARGPEGLVAIAVEGKVNEEFGPHVSHWLKGASQGKKTRLAAIAEALGLKGFSLDVVRYQLLHRAASVIFAAQRFGASNAVLLVHSFSPSAAWFEDFAVFAELLAARVTKNTVNRTEARTPIPLHLGWVTGARRFLDA